ncbi:unnamed protein product, partial [Mesorhabditis spiculigera]
MTDFFNKHIKKTTARTKEKLLEGLGRNKATQDETFDFYANNLQKQSKACERLHKDFKAYSVALKELNKAEKALRDSVREVYEDEWPNKANLTSVSQSIDWEGDNLEKQVCEDMVGSVGQYVQQFAELKKKVEKRGRKLVDYDHARNGYNSLKEGSKKESDPKVAKALTELQQAEQMYKEINGELLEILPATFDSRITFIVDTLQSLFNAQASQQTECAKHHKQMITILDELGESMDSLRVARPPSRIESPSENHKLATPSIERRSPSPSASLERNGDSTRQSITSAISEKSKSTKDSKETKEESEVEEPIQNKVYPKLNAAPPPTASPRSEDKQKKPKREKDPNNPFDESDDEEDLGLGRERKVLRVVESTHKYEPQDTDELAFVAGEKIKVLDSFETDQLDDGWLIGENQDGVRGIFPENFTKNLH